MARSPHGDSLRAGWVFEERTELDCPSSAETTALYTFAERSSNLSKNLSFFPMFPEVEGPSLRSTSCAPPHDMISGDPSGVDDKEV
jgi:hypothetical protein